MEKKYLPWLFVTILIIVAIFVFLPQEKIEDTDSKVTTIAEIISNPEAYEGKTVIIYGKYGGWSGDECPKDGLSSSAMYTRSDAGIGDKTGCISMSARGGIEILYQEAEDLDPMQGKGVGTALKIKAVVSLIDGEPILGTNN